MKRSLLSLLFPPLCLSCDAVLVQPGRILCDQCGELLELIDPTHRCPRCFSHCPSKRCPHCTKSPSPFSGMAAAFEYAGPPAILVKKMKHGGLSYLAKILASCLITQLDRLNWPELDLIIPVPLSLDRRLSRGFNHSALIGKELSQMIGVPIKEVLRRPLGQKPLFCLKKEADIEDATILLLDDLVITGQTLKQCGNALLEGFPNKIYGFSVCKKLI